MSDTIPSRPHRRRSWAEPFKIKVVEPIKMTSHD
jgi:tyrosine phenol-lyase